MDFTIEHIDPQTLTPHPENWRRHPAAQRRALTASIAEHGWLAAPIWNRRTGHLLDGHARVEVALSETAATIPVRVIDVPPAQERRILASFDRIGELRDRDDEALTALLQELAAEPEGLPAGWEAKDLETLLGEAAGENGLKADADPDALPDDAPTRCQAGDLWELGAHRLAVGDSTDPAVVARLLGAKKISLVWTDPPYGVSYAEKNEFLNAMDKGNKNQTPIQNDAMSEAETEALCRAALFLACEHAMPGAAVYVACPSGTLLPHFIAAVAAAGFTYKHSLVWVKNQFVLGRCDYHYRHETILYGWKENGAHFFVDDHTKDSVFAVDKPRKSEQHPTMKPVELVRQMIENSTRATDIVYDPFGGSGTTLIACEQTGRSARLVELAPGYGDVIVARWEQATGKTARRVE